MKNVLFLVFFIFAASTALAQRPPVTVRLPQEKGWVGQRVPFYIELHANGSFDGTASFGLPQIPGAIVIKTGSPVVSSEEIDGQSWFIQSHEFALFSQRAGTLELPQFPIRFSSRDGFTGPASETQTAFPGMKVEIIRPPGSEKVGFLVTSESLEISEQWSPEPKPVQAGAVFKRTILQRAGELSGMALSPPSTSVPGSIRVYTEDAKIQDKYERGAFLGERSDTITYQFPRAGSFSLPELTYVWWNPKSETLETMILPGVRFEVSAAPVPASATQRPWYWYFRLFPPLLFIALVLWQRKWITAWIKKCWKDMYPADRVLARKLLRACRQNNSAAAGNLWLAWRNTQGADFEPGPELQASVLSLQRYLFGPEPAGVWNGDALASAFARQIKNAKGRTYRQKTSLLPELNGQ